MTLAALTPLTTACLAPERGSVRGGDLTGTDTDTSDTSPDTSTDTLETYDTDDACSALSCDDQDPCTFDSCEAGVCQHVALDSAQAPPRTECVEDPDCDDGDPCTDDACVGLDGDCRTTSLCTHTPRVGCGVTDCDLDSEDLCEDGDPCTLDRCVPLAGCVHEPVGEGLCEPACKLQHAEALGDLRTRPEGSEALVAGTLAADVCLTDALPCTVQPTLGDGTETVTLYGDRAGTCTLEALPRAACDPMIIAARYLVWGRTRGASSGVSPGRADAVPVIPPMPGLDVEGYCLDVSALDGGYRGVLSIERDEVIVFDAVITSRDAAPVLAMSNVRIVSSVWARVDTAAFAAQAPALAVDEGRVSLSLELPWLNATPEVEQVTLFATAEMLVGAVGPIFSPASGADRGASEDTLPFGELRLVRVARGADR